MVRSCGLTVCIQGPDVNPVVQGEVKLPSPTHCPVVVFLIGPVRKLSGGRKVIGHSFLQSGLCYLLSWM